ncbi:AbiJ-NTD4 domain-containing protein [Aureispira sp. CCB-E]|uniref:AbiJ-NTD4 domain-containing protein n=1 Tax=Aureispira sp. CCB-E TaxID=3051121 RepID=UPI002868D671|nr:hypothetical protein [Aureispira sp. CCB-E]WMX12308.1 hypothetical protein QP953_15880 [Aureispira sp. CCB-E]
MKFSEREGFESKRVKDSFQLESMDDILRNKIWNAAYRYYFMPLLNGQSNERDKSFYLFWVEFLGYLEDEVPWVYYDDLKCVDVDTIYNEIKDWYFKAEWYKRYDLLEYIVELTGRYEPGWMFDMNCNIVLRDEKVGYRFVNKKITPITSDVEIEEVETAIQNSLNWTSVTTHLETSIKYLSIKNPDYRNSLKESISAVEAMCEIILGKKSGGLGAALAEIAKTYDLDPALKKGFSALYGHASNKGGARHSLSEDDTPITMEYARYMLISCSAFVNYLKTKNEKI